MTTQPDSELDDILEDLIVGHNFEYARKALLEWKEHCVLQKQIDELKYWFGEYLPDKSIRNDWLNTKPISIQRIEDRIAELQAELKAL